MSMQFKEMTNYIEQLGATEALHGQITLNYLWTITIISSMGL